MNIFISGGCKNGKSMYAQELAKKMSCEKKVQLYYLATMKPMDNEDLDRISRHIEERKGWGFKTIEQSNNICQCLKMADKDGSFLLDSVTALLSNEMFHSDGSIDFEAPQRVARELEEFAERTGNTVFVSDYIYSDAEVYDEVTEAYREGLALIDKALAKVCHRVIEFCAGNAIEYK